MQLLDVSRRDAVLATVTGPAFFAHGIEAVTGCSILRGELELKETDAKGVAWSLALKARGQQAYLALRDGMYADAAEVLGLSDTVLFEQCGVQDVA